MINIISPINQLGYGIAGINLLKALSKQTDVALWPIGQPSVTNRADADAVSLAIQNSRMPDFSAPCVRVWHQHDMSQFVGKGLRVGFPIFELDKFNELEVHHLSSLDKIFVCSNWAKNVVLSEVNIDKSDVHVIPLGVDTDTFKPAPPREDSKTIFFNCGKWEVRKGHDILVQAFNNAFSEDDDVELWMMCENPFYSETEQLEWINLYKNSKLGDKVRIIDRVESHEEVYNIMSEVDCGVFPSRGEGWNLELLEMMACGKQVIATSYAAHTEFCNDSNCLLVHPDGSELAYDGKWFHGKCGSWMKITAKQIDEISAMMQRVHRSKTLNHSGVLTAKKYNWNRSASTILTALNLSQKAPNV